MESGFTFIDVETPNWGNDSICAIGIIRVGDDGNQISRRSYFIDPEAHFDSMNIAIHGITPEMVEGAPTFPELWNEFLGEYLTSPIVVAHNATFDLGVIRKTMEHYGLGDLEARYACTYWMSRKAYPDWGRWRLPNVCRNLGIRLAKHHDPLADVDACFDIYRTLLNGDLGAGEFSRYAGGHKVREAKPRHFSDRSIKMRSLIEMMKAAENDGVLDAAEGMDILSFIASDEALAHDKALSPVVEIIQNAVIDGEIDQAESSRLFSAMDLIIDPISASARDENDIQFEGRTFCLTGEFEHGSRDKAVAPLIEAKGGTIKKGVIKKLDYLVVGDLGSKAYSLETYGGKVKKALDFNAGGADIKIVRESDLFSALQ